MNIYFFFFRSTHLLTGKVRCCNLFFSRDEKASLNGDVNVALAFSSIERILLEPAEYSFSGAVTLLTKVTVSLRERK